MKRSADQTIPEREIADSAKNAGNEPPVPKRDSETKIHVEQKLEISLLCLNGTQRKNPCRTKAGNQPSIPKRHSETKIPVEQMLKIILLFISAR